MDAMTIPDLFPEVAPHNGNADDNQRYTIRRARGWCKGVAGVTEWDLDAAACFESHHAECWYGLDQPRAEYQNGLIAPWFGDVFVNPPWDDIAPWIMKAWRAWSEPEPIVSLISISMLLPGGRTHRPWWKDLVEPFRDGRRDHRESPHPAYLVSHNPPERFPYGGPGNPEGVGVAEPNFTSVLLVWRRA